MLNSRLAVALLAPLSIGVALAGDPPPTKPDSGRSQPSSDSQAPPSEQIAPRPQVADAKRYASLAAVIETTRGTIRAELAPDAVPRMTAHFVNLVERGFYDDLAFYSVVAGVQLHAGDPTGTGDSGCGYQIAPAFHRTLLFDTAGTLGLWTQRGREVTSQFFITLAPMASKYNLFQPGLGKVVDGLDVARSITADDRIVSVVIEGDPTLLRTDFKDEIAGWDEILDDPARAGRELRPRRAAAEAKAPRKPSDGASEPRGADAPATQPPSRTADAPPSGKEP
ncbi:MAG TPA: peptidylprolyl isomerase [Phycisphaerales bacterium]|nr:peptidylprolyl isomerase [Phycisphaerales bacterium]HMP38015.1 peptidylprolyl isomerase [Phycisphaerales bacterium]